MKKIVACLFLLFLFGCTEESKTYEPPIISLDRYSEINGSFIFGCGNIDQERHYYVYTQEPDGGYVERRLPVHMVKIYETDAAPKIKFVNFFKIKQGDIDRYGACTRLYDKACIELYIPQNSIMRIYDPNLNNESVNGFKKQERTP
jgi:hypothetical protein